jgi:hypothetical protein
VILIAMYGCTRTSNPFDPRDVDGSGKINFTDAIKAISLCTRPGCALR